MLNNQYPSIKDQFEANKISWVKSSREGISQDRYGNYLPWMTYSFIEYICPKLRNDQTVFEYGAGSSTLFFANKVKNVITIESNEIWYKIIKKKLDQDNITNVKLIYLNNAINDESYELFASNCQEKFDLVVVDSLKRFACAKNSINAIKPNGAIILDDSERKNYQKIFDFFLANNFNQKNYPGIAPGSLKIKNSTIFFRLNSIFN